MRALLDVNVLIALLDPSHVHHAMARQWLTANIRHGWASCAITQLGCIRVMSSSAYPARKPAGLVAARLAEATRTPHHEFWGECPAPVADGLMGWGDLLTSRHSTDVYLLALAVHNKGRLATFDGHVPLGAAGGATTRSLAVIE
jgi:uncharacterized protein